MAGKSGKTVDSGTGLLPYTYPPRRVSIFLTSNSPPTRMTIVFFHRKGKGISNEPALPAILLIFGFEPFLRLISILSKALAQFIHSPSNANLIFFDAAKNSPVDMD